MHSGGIILQSEAWKTETIQRISSLWVNEMMSQSTHLNSQIALIAQNTHVKYTQPAQCVPPSYENA